MNIFMTGATGYIGGTIARRLLDDGHKLRGLVRDAEKGKKLAAFGVEPVIGGLDDTAILTAEARHADAVINTANSDHRGAVEAFLDGLAGSNKPFIHTSGSSIVADDAHGDVASDKIYDEDTPVDPVPGKKARVAIDRMVRDASGHGVRSVVVCPTMIYGNGLGLARDSAQIPGLASRTGRRLPAWCAMSARD